MARQKPHHAIGLITSGGVELGGKHVTAHVAVDQAVKKGDLPTTPMIVCNTDDYQSVTP